VKIQRILSVVFILMVLLSSTGYTSPNDFMVEPDQPPTELGSCISEDSDVDLLEFRRVVGVSIGGSIAFDHPSACYETSKLLFTSVSIVQVNSFLHRRASQNRTIKIFISLGMLVI
jgi:hypothetical protein